MRISIIFILFILFSSIAGAQKVRWQKTYGGNAYDQCNSVCLTREGNYVMAGYTRSNDGDVSGNHGDQSDFWIIKLNYYGDTLWKKTYGGTKEDEAMSIKQTKDGGFIIAGTISSNDGDIKASLGRYDFWVIKLDALGNMKWMKSLGGTGNDKVRSVIETSDSGYVVLGETGSRNGYVGKQKGSIDLWMAKVNKKGEYQWERSYGGLLSETGCTMIETPDKGLLIAGATESTDDDIVSNHGERDVWLLKTDAFGYKQWSKTYGGSDFEEPHAIIKALGGGYIIAATTFSKDQQIQSNAGKCDIWIFKITEDGEMEWSKTYGGSEMDGANDIITSWDGCYIIAGMTSSKDKLITKNAGYFDAWLLKINASGTLLWQKTFGGKMNDIFTSVKLTADTSYACFGHTESSDQLLKGVKKFDGNDFWFLSARDPLLPDTTFYLPPTTIVGYVRDIETKGFIPANIEIVNNATNVTITSMKIDTVDGIYIQTIPAYVNSSISVSADGYLFYGDNLVITDENRYKEIRRDIELEKLRIGAKLALHNIFFDSGKSSLKSESFPELERCLKFMKRNPSVRIKIGGHTDDTGDPATKKQLSLNRANEVKNWLLAKGVNNLRVSTAGYGMSKPIAPNTSEEGRQLNRRVEFEVTSLK